jgi:hypothetical protein
VVGVLDDCEELMADYLDELPLLFFRRQFYKAFEKRTYDPIVLKGRGMEIRFQWPQEIPGFYLTDEGVTIMTTPEPKFAILSSEFGDLNERARYDLNSRINDVYSMIAPLHMLKPKNPPVTMGFNPHMFGEPGPKLTIFS